MNACQEMKAGSVTASLKWTWQTKNGTIPAHQNKRIPHTGICKMTLFWDHQDPLVEHYTSKGMTVISASYCNLLQNHLRPAVRSKHHGLISTGAVSLYNNARLHTFCVPDETIRDIHFECLSYPWANHRGSWWKDFPIQWGSARGNEWVAMHAQRIFSWGIRLHWSAGGHALNTIGTMLKNDRIIQNLFALNWLVKTF